MIIPNNGDSRSVPIGKIVLPDFAVSWAGDNPWEPGYCFGSEDGRVQFTKVASNESTGLFAIAPSEEAINGIAFADSLMAASTRCEVVFLNVPYQGQGHVERTVFPGGAHGVIGTQGGSIVAPMGDRGILVMGPKQPRAQRVKIMKAADSLLNFYRVVSIGDAAGAEILACAARRSGFAAMPFSSAGLRGFGKVVRPNGVDFVDVAALGLQGYPSAAAAVGLDCSLHFVRDLVSDRTSRTLRFDTIRERAYRLLCAEGHVFLLTNRRLYAFANLASRFLDEQETSGPVSVRHLDLEAVDASLAFDRSLLVVMPDAVYRIEIDALVAGDRAPANEAHAPLASSLGTTMSPKDVRDELWTTFDEARWEQSEELELAGVG